MLKMKSNSKLLKIIVLNSVEEILFQIDKTVGLTWEWIESRLYSPGVGNLSSTGHYAANNSTPKTAAGTGLHSPPPIKAPTPRTQDYHLHMPYNCALSKAHYCCLNVCVIRAYHFIKKQCDFRHRNNLYTPLPPTTKYTKIFHDKRS